MKTAKILLISLIMVSGMQGALKDIKKLPFIRNNDGWKPTVYVINGFTKKVWMTGDEGCPNNNLIVSVSRPIVRWLLNEKGTIPHAHEYCPEYWAIKEGICANPSCKEVGKYWKTLDWRGPTVVLAGLALLAYKNRDALKKRYEQAKDYIQKLSGPKAAQEKECSEK